MTRMLGWANAGVYDPRDDPFYGDSQLLRRRNRAREKEAVRRELRGEGKLREAKNRS